MDKNITEAEIEEARALIQANLDPLGGGVGSHLAVWYWGDDGVPRIEAWGIGSLLLELWIAEVQARATRRST